MHITSDGGRLPCRGQALIACATRDDLAVQDLHRLENPAPARKESIPRVREGRAEGEERGGTDPEDNQSQRNDLPGTTDAVPAKHHANEDESNQRGKYAIDQLR